MPAGCPACPSIHLRGLDHELKGWVASFPCTDGSHCGEGDGGKQAQDDELRTHHDTPRVHSDEDPAPGTSCGAVDITHKARRVVDELYGAGPMDTPPRGRCQVLLRRVPCGPCAEHRASGDTVRRLRQSGSRRKSHSWHTL